MFLTLQMADVLLDTRNHRNERAVMSSAIFSGCVRRDVEENTTTDSPRIQESYIDAVTDAGSRKIEEEKKQQGGS